MSRSSARSTNAVERDTEHVVVEKQGLAARIAAKLDPRTAYAD